MGDGVPEGRAADVPRDDRRTVARWEWLLLVLIFVASMGELVPLAPSIHGDGVGYFAYLRSTVFDRDLDFRDEYQHFGQRTTLQMAERAPTRTGLVHNVWSVGPAILWSPFFLGGHVVAVSARALGWRVETDGYSEPYVYAIALASALYGFGGLLLVYRLCRQRFGPFPSLAALAAVWFATSLTAYMYFHPSLSHPVSLFLTAAFFSLWWGNRLASSVPRWIVLGMLAGVMAATRLQNALYLAPLALYEVHLSYGSLRTHGYLRKRLACWLAFAVAAVLTFAPQMVAWWVLYGRLITNSQAEFSGPDLFNWTNPHLWDVLFSSRHGLLSWTPVVGLALVGLATLVARGDGLARALGLSFLLQWYLVSAWANWWQGASFGGRMFIELTPAFAIGLAALVSPCRKTVPRIALVAVVALAALWNLLFIFQYGSGLLPLEDDVSWELVVRNQFSYAPASLLALIEKTGGWFWAGLLFLIVAVGAMAIVARRGNARGSRAGAVGAS